MGGGRVRGKSRSGGSMVRGGSAAPPDHRTQGVVWSGRPVEGSGHGKGSSHSNGVVMVRGHYVGGQCGQGAAWLGRCMMRGSWG